MKEDKIKVTSMFDLNNVYQPQCVRTGFVTSAPIPESKFDEIKKAIEEVINRPLDSLGGDRDVDWEIECIVNGNKNYWRQKNGLYNSQLFAEHVTWEWLLEHGGYIFQVKRKSDNSLWSIGNILEKWGKISSFKIQDKWMLAICNDGEEKPAHVFIEDFVQPLPQRTSERPPLGLQPTKFWIAGRLNGIDEAIARFQDAKKEIPQSWLLEKDKLIEWDKSFVGFDIWENDNKDASPQRTKWIITDAMKIWNLEERVNYIEKKLNIVG